MFEFLFLEFSYVLRVFENTLLRRIYEHKMDRVIGGWRKLHEEFHNLYSSPIFWMIKSRRMG
jgi:hypothetical protein